jgi:hypothetical protein
MGQGVYFLARKNGNKTLLNSHEIEIFYNRFFVLRDRDTFSIRIYIYIQRNA